MDDITVDAKFKRWTYPGLRTVVVVGELDGTADPLVVREDG